MLFFESIKIKNGKVFNLPLHMQRMNQARSAFGGNLFSLQDVVLYMEANPMPQDLSKAMVKCRLVYNLREMVSIEYVPYHLRTINTLKLVEAENINYGHKFADRSPINKLLEMKGNSDEILIVQDGFITDTSFSNLVFRNNTGLFTPSSYLLNGTKRQLLLQNGIIQEIAIAVGDLKKYEAVYLINALIDIEDEVCVAIADIG